MILSLYNREVDVSSFFERHPGGRSILRKYIENGKDCTEAFERVGHSEHAFKLMKNLPCKSGNIEEMTSRSKSRCSRLCTNEDPFMLHKLCGLLSLLHFVICYYRFFTSGMITFGVDYGIISKAFMLIHACLALLALQFPVEPLRIKGTQNMTVEQVQHTIVFSFRSLLFYALGPVSVAWRVVLVICHHIIADVVTARYHRKENGTTIRGGVPDDWVPGFVLKVRNVYAGVAQFGATISMLTCVHNPGDAALLSLIPIQLGAFANTLTKKHIIGSFGHGVIYGGSLLVSYLFFLQSPLCLLLFAVQYVARCFGINKYLLMISAPFIAHQFDLFVPVRYPMEALTIN